jgi:hypothetical protein
VRVTVVDVEQVNDTWRVTKDVEADDGTVTRLLHVLPVDTMEWRAAEYGIDPSDRDTLVEMVLLEPHLDDGVDERHARSLGRAPSIADARAFHLERIAAAKKRVTLSGAGGAGRAALERIRDESPIEAEVVVVKAEHVGIERARIRRKAESERAGEARDRAERVRALLAAQRGGARS